MVIIEKAARQNISLLLLLEAGKTKATTNTNKKTNAKKTIQKLRQIQCREKKQSNKTYYTLGLVRL